MNVFTDSPGKRNSKTPVRQNRTRYRGGEQASKQTNTNGAKGRAPKQAEDPKQAGTNIKQVGCW